MKIAGVICEYNPFHNGHAHHIRLTRQRSGCDWVVCCMVGAFTQRGEPAIVDKFLRAEMALRCGADAVVELPALFALRSADGFATGGVGILAALGADVLSFGSEVDDLATLERMAQAREVEPEWVSQAIQAGLREGKSHARARGEAWSACFGMEASQPNAILAAEYLRAIRAQGVDMEPLLIRRAGGYHDPTLTPMASATAVRQALRRGESVRSAVPENAWELLENAPLSGSLDDIGLHLLRTADLSTVLGAGEGLENRVARAAETAPDLESLVQAVKCKRYTRARIARLVAAAMVGLSAELAREHPMPEYVRLLGYRAEARPLVARMARGTLPLVTRGAELRGHPVFELERRATDLWGLSTRDPELRAAGRDCTRRLLVV